MLGKERLEEDKQEKEEDKNKESNEGEEDINRRGNKTCAGCSQEGKLLTEGRRNTI